MQTREVENGSAVMWGCSSFRARRSIQRLDTLHSEATQVWLDDPGYTLDIPRIDRVWEAIRDRDGKPAASLIVATKRTLDGQWSLIKRGRIDYKTLGFAVAHARDVPIVDVWRVAVSRRPLCPTKRTSQTSGKSRYPFLSLGDSI